MAEIKTIEQARGIIKKLYYGNIIKDYMDSDFARVKESARKITEIFKQFPGLSRYRFRGGRTYIDLVNNVLDKVQKKEATFAEGGITRPKEQVLSAITQTFLPASEKEDGGLKFKTKLK